MTIYSVFASRRAQDKMPAVVPERFSWFAALLPPFYLIAHRAGLALLLYLAGVALIVGASMLIGAEAGFWLYGLFAAWIGFAAPGFRRFALHWRGYRHSGEIVAAGEDLAQLEALKLGNVE